MGLNRRVSARCTPGEMFQRWTPMILLIGFPILCHSQTALEIMDSSSPIEAILGQNVTIPCVLTDKYQPEKDLDLNLATDSVRWNMVSSNGSEDILYLFTNGRHTPYRQKSNVKENGFKRGNASLTLYNVQQSDEGKYVCNVFVAGNKLIATRNVEVSARPIVKLSSYEITIAPGNEQSVTCYVRNFYPKSVDIRWEKRSHSSERFPLDKETCTSVPTQAEDGTFNVTSLMSVKPSSVEEDRDQYFCIVTHRSFKSDHFVSFTVTVKDTPTIGYLLAIIIIISMAIGILAIALFAYYKKLRPEISDIAGIDDLFHGQSSNLSWMVSGFKPRDIEIRAYLERGDQRQEICSWTYPRPKVQNYGVVYNVETENGIILLEQENENKTFNPKRSGLSYSCFCSTSITPDKMKDKEAELIIEVKHAALKRLLTKRQKLNIKGDYFTAHITAPQWLKPGAEVTLTCDIKKCDPDPLFIIWRKGEKDICRDGTIEDPRYKHTEKRDVPNEGNVLMSSSSLTFTVMVKEDHGVTYTCMVIYSAIGKVLKPSLEAFVAAQPVVEPIASKHVGQQMELSCRVHSFYPQTIKIKWFKEEVALTTTDSELDTDEDGLYSTTSILMYVPEMEDIGKTFRCQVGHQSLPKAETRELKFEEDYRNECH
ncbi:uncharacterized protein LOC120917004 isoform X2 [Rana temporaria]|uniref:uncharacterized protein LOC120917004 isoform X2 n=1 Tax=Rana temporaria TaxID=8407 RepID=UPI001AAD2054|nr:uncharacterized protein LOC120917004 isoform X2 [Rana temporaria]